MNAPVGPPLARHYRRWLIGLAAALGSTTVLAALLFVLWPMARRSADDLAGLMVLSAQTWSELPPDTRPAFEQELRLRHRLALRSDGHVPAQDALRHGFYIAFLEDSLQQRLGAPARLYQDPAPAADEPAWIWTAVPAGGRLIGVGFDPRRLDTHPLYALAAIAAVGGALATALAAALAARIARPVAQLERAAAALAAGQGPERLPERGPAELARLAGHFNHMARQVSDLLEARTTLLAGVSHDLRTPLARMRLALEMLRARPDDERLIERIEQDITAMDSLIGQMLDLARGLATEAVVEIELQPWLQARVRAHEAAARAAGAQLSVQAAAGLCALAGTGALERVVDNLLGNALRYAPGPIELSAQALPAADPAAPPKLRLCVSDRGPGIAAADLASVWRPFHRLEASRSPHTGGWGLGLAVVRQLAQIHGWQTWLQPREGGGLQACVDLPATVASAPQVQDTPAAQT
ncbi:MAG: ATP-binding protein [Burkholderiaceae bacterium]|nr:ATP-binding protein [Burkholderiaceae bacterium]